MNGGKLHYQDSTNDPKQIQINSKNLNIHLDTRFSRFKAILSK